jgi:paraquat-inducible protein A
MQLDSLVICEECDLMQKKAPLESGDEELCTRCGYSIYKSKPNGLQYSLVFALTAFVLFILSNTYPIVTISSQGLNNSTTLLGVVQILYKDDMLLVAILVLVTTFLTPVMEIGALIYLLLPLKFGVVLPGMKVVYRWMHQVRPWVMVEVFMLGLLITISKLSGLAFVVPEIALISFVLLMFAIIIASINFDERMFWHQVETLSTSQRSI